MTHKSWYKDSGDVEGVLEHLEAMPAIPGNPTVVAGAGVTHLRYPVRKAMIPDPSTR